MTGPEAQSPRTTEAAGAPAQATEQPYLEEEGGGLDLRRYIAALLRHKWLILGLGAAGLAAGFVASRVVKPIYEVQATIQIDQLRRSTSPIQTDQILENRGWLDLVRSFAVLEEVVKRRKLYLTFPDPGERAFFTAFELGSEYTTGRYQVKLEEDGKRVTLRTGAGVILDQQPLGDSIGKVMGFRWAPADLPVGRALEFSIRTPREAAVVLSSALQVPPIPVDGSFMRMTLRGADPMEITATVNALAERFVEVGAYLKRDKLTQVTEVLRAQLDRAQNDLRTAENSLETFKINTITLPNDRGATPIASGLAETRDPVRQAFFRLRLDRDSLDQEREAIDRALRAGDSSTSLVISLGAIPSVRSSTELNAALNLLSTKRSEAREMRLTAGPSYAPLQKLEREIEELERVTVPTQARNVSANLTQRISDLAARIAASGQEMQAIPARVSEESRRERNVLIASNLYTQLQAAYEQAKLAELSAAPDVRLLDAAKAPLEPVTDQLVQIVLGGLLGGLGLGIALSLLLDRFDRRIRYPEQITRDLGLTILGTLPVMKTSRRGNANADSVAQLLESTRGIRMSLSYAHGSGEGFITTITSPGPGDGKSFTSANLARAFAASGRRTLLIDADTRRGLLHRSFSVERRPGLLDYLSGKVKREEMIRTLPDYGIDFIPSGTRLSNGPELLAAPAMARLVAALRTEYQAIIVDSPPLGAGVDPLVLAALCGSMVVVLRSGVTDRELAEARLQEISRYPIRMLGAILNDIRTEGVYRYYGYLPGYRAEDETETKAATPVRAGSGKS